MSEESEDFVIASLARREWLVDGLLSPLATCHPQKMTT